MAAAIKKMIPLMDRILVQRAEAAHTTKGGIMLPDKAVEKVLQATVIAVGPGLRNTETGNHIPLEIKEGDRVLLPNYGGTKVELEDKKEYMIFRESEILAKLE